MVLPCCDVALRQVEELRHAFILLAQQLLQHFAGLFELARAHERFGIGHEEWRVILRGRERLQNRNRAHRVPAL